MKRAVSDTFDAQREQFVISWRRITGQMPTREARADFEARQEKRSRVSGFIGSNFTTGFTSHCEAPAAAAPVCGGTLERGSDGTPAAPILSLPPD